MKKTINSTHLEGYVYEHNLVVKQVQNTESANYGKDFISGTLDVATDDECCNIVQVHFTYVTETTSKGTKNKTYTVLKNIIDGGKTVIVDGKDSAMMVRIDTAIDLNDFDTVRDGEEVHVAAKRLEGGFVHVVQKLAEEPKRNRFECDMLINGAHLVEADEERHIPVDYLVVKGAVFNFRNEILPIEFIVKSKDGIDYFQSLDASQSNLVFTKVWGYIHPEIIIEEAAFGEVLVKDYTRNAKEWILTGAASAPYEIGEESPILTFAEIKDALAKRETKLAEDKKRNEEYRANRQASAPAGVTANAAAASFMF